MKTMKKLMAIVMVIAIVMAMAVTVSAADTTGTISITKAKGGTEYSVYQIFEAINVNDTTGKYDLKLTAAWAGFNGEEVQIGSETFNLNNYFTVDANGVLTSVPSASDGAALAAIAQKYAAANPTTITPTATETPDSDSTLTLSGLPCGYYLVSSDLTLSVDGAVKKYGMGLLEPTVDGSDPTVTVNEKNTTSGLPEISKTTSSGDEYKVGDVRDYTITLTMDEGDTTYTIIDTMTGMVLADANRDGVVNADDITVTPVAGAGITKEPAIDNASFKVIIAFTEGNASKANETVTITYKAKVTEAGVDGIGNSVSLDGEGRNDVLDTDLYKFILKKVDGSNELTGAKFKLYSDKDATIEIPLFKVGDYYRPANGDAELAAAVEIEAGTATIKGLPAGTYYLKETKAPAGYKLLTATTDVPIVVNFDGSYTVDGESSDVPVKIANSPIEPLPETGGMGTTLFYVVGGMMAAAALVLLVTKKRMAA